MGYVVGIDLGTTNSVVALLSAGKPQVIPNAEGSKTTPSVVLYNAEDQVVVGDLAKRQRMLNPARTIHSIKRFVGCRWDESAPRRTGLHYPLTEGPDGLVRLEVEGRELLPEAVQAEILIKLKRDAEAYLGEPVEQAVITCPAYFNDSQRLATKKAAELAGLEALRIVNEPTAAALAYGIGRKHSEKIAVFDFGGGTFDISILEINEDVFEVLATCGDTFLGGDRIDQLLTRWIADAVLEQTGIDPTSDPQAMSRIAEAAEKAKCELSTLPRTSLVLPFLVSDASGPKHFNAELSREQFETLIAPVLAELEPPCLQAMQDAGLTADKLHGVVLVGGSTRIPAVQVLVQRIFGREPDKSVNPDEAVALGAAIQAGIMRGDLDEILLLDVTPLSLGIELSGGLFSPLIPRNSSIPTVAKRKFTTVVDNQTAVRIHVLQGERRVAGENRSLGHFRLEGIAPAPREVPEIEVSFNVDANGILSVAAMDLTTGALQQVIIESYQPRMDGDVQRLSSEGEAKAEDDRRFMRKLAVRQRIEDLRADLAQHLKAAEASLAENQERRLHEAYFRVDAALVREDWATLEVAERELKSIYTEIMMLTGGVAGKIADDLVFENQPDSLKPGESSGITLEIPSSN